MIADLFKNFLLLLIRAYQALLSPLFYGSCRFHPSCSHYAAEAVEAHGAVKGAWLALGRLLRCQPFCRGGFDPVPENFPAKPKRANHRLYPRSERDQAMPGIRVSDTGSIAIEDDEAARRSQPDPHFWRYT